MYGACRTHIHAAKRSEICRNEALVLRGSSSPNGTWSPGQVALNDTTQWLVQMLCVCDLLIQPNIRRLAVVADMPSSTARSARRKMCDKQSVVIAIGQLMLREISRAAVKENGVDLGDYDARSAPPRHRRHNERQGVACSSLRFWLSDVSKKKCGISSQDRP